MLGLENHASKRFSEKKPLQDLTDNRLPPSAPYKTWDLEVRILIAMWGRRGLWVRRREWRSITVPSEAQEQRRKINSKLRST